jgi:56kDa selenium binding protein (SBP56)
MFLCSLPSCGASMQRYVDSMRRKVAGWGCPILLLCATGLFAQVSRTASVPSQNSQASPYLFLWAGDANAKNSDFLAVIDARPESKSYGKVIATVPVNEMGTMPHHTQYEFPSNSILFANGWAAGRTFLFNLDHPASPRIIERLGGLAGYSFPHSFAQLPNGHVLATLQGKGSAYIPIGGLVELDERGNVVRSASAADATVGSSLIWPYSLVVVPKDDRIIVTSFVMGGFPHSVQLPIGSWSESKINATNTKHVQIWSLSELKLLSTIELPSSPEGGHEQNPAEPRVLQDGSVYINTFNCGLYHLHGLTGKGTTAHFVFAFPGGDLDVSPCGIPVVVGKFWIQTVSALPGLVVLDVSNPEKPIEVSRLTLDNRFKHPHWVAADRHGSRLVITGSMESWVLIVNVDAGTGKLSVDESFRQEGFDVPALNWEHFTWPHGESGKAIPHGALFGPY